MKPYRQTIPYGRQSVDENDIRAVTETLNSDWLTQGPRIEEFEEALANYCGAEYAVVVSNGTAALHLINLALGVKPGQQVVTSPLTFVATPNSVIYAGGTPVFGDVETGSFNLDPRRTERIIYSTEHVVGIIPVHLGGLVPDLESFYSLAKESRAWIVEDACHSVGGRWRDSQGAEHRVGDCSFSDATVFSFHPVKHVTTGEGGAILTNNEELYHTLLMLRTHGITKNEEEYVSGSDGGWYYEMQTLGFNYRLTDLQATLGISQLKKSDQWVKRRLDLVAKYDNAFEKISQVDHQKHPVNQEHSYHLYIALVENREALYNYLRDHNIYCQVHYIPVHLQPFYREQYGCKPGDFPVAEEYYKCALSLPLFPTLTDEEQDYVINCISEFYETS